MLQQCSTFQVCAHISVYNCRFLLEKMAAAAVQGEQLSTILQCSICIDVFTDPRILPCLHTFCCKCIADWCEDKQRGGKVTCPECREEFVIPDSGVDGLKKNFYITNMLSINEEKQKTQELWELCIGEVDKVSEMFCLQCEQSYCESCSKGHLKIRNFKSHKLVRLDELQSGVDLTKNYRPQYCDKHSEELIKLISSLQKIKTHHEQEIDKVNQKLTQAEALLSTFRDYCEERLKKGSDVDICRERNSLCRKTEELLNQKYLEDSLAKLVVPNVIFSFSRFMTFEDSMSAIGELEAGNSHINLLDLPLWQINMFINCNTLLSIIESY
jgi:RING-type zinc-finger